MVVRTVLSEALILTKIYATYFKGNVVKNAVVARVSAVFRHRFCRVFGQKIKLTEEEFYMEINVIDSIMGSGKTSWAIQYMNEAPATESFIYVTPFLAEVSRIKKDVGGRTFVEPNNNNEAGTKLRSLKELLADRKDIATSHALFSTADEEVRELLSEANYTLILDESFTAVEPVNVKKSDVARLLRSNDIRIDVLTNRVDWIGDEKDGGRYEDIRELAHAGVLYCYRSNLFVWTFPSEVFASFSKAYVMTYLFNGQPMRFYFDIFKFPYKKHSVVKNGGRYEIVDYDPRKENRKSLRALINVYEGNYNDLKSEKVRNVTLSATNSITLAKDDKFVKKLTGNLRGYFERECKVSRDSVMYSAKQELMDKLRPEKYNEPNISKQERKKFYADPDNKHRKIPPKVKIPVNSRATNVYAHKSACAYLYNYYMNVNVKAFFQDNGCTIDRGIEDIFAIGEFLQWLFRSRIRNGEPINLYLPSSRMRGLLDAWANYGI